MYGDYLECGHVIDFAMELPEKYIKYFHYVITRVGAAKLFKKYFVGHVPIFKKVI